MIRFLLEGTYSDKRNHILGTRVTHTLLSSLSLLSVSIVVRFLNVGGDSRWVFHFLIKKNILLKEELMLELTYLVKNLRICAKDKEKTDVSSPLWTHYYQLQWIDGWHLSYR